MSSNGASFDVAIVGYGPVGAALAGLLGRRGLSVAVFDREVDVFPLPRAAHIDHQGLRCLQELGCLDEVLPSMRLNAGMDFVTKDLEVLMRVPGSSSSRSGLPASMYFHQPGFDRAIRTAVEQQPSVTTFLGCEVTGLEQGSDGVTLVAVDRDRVDHRVTASWVVGCDGARSTVRPLVEIGLDDLGFDEDWLVVDTVLSRPVAALPDRALQVCDPARPHTVLPMPGQRYRFELMLLPGENPAAMQGDAVVKQLLARWLSPDMIEVERQAVYRFHGLVARSWRSGRVLLAGDAAHQMPPFLGQGMCSGLRDATNLAWKLDHVLRRGGPESLVDSYEIERKPHVRSIIEAAVSFGRIICVLDQHEAAERDRVMLADPTPPESRRPFALPHLTPGRLVLDNGGELFVQPEPVRSEARFDDLIGQRFLVLGRTVAALGDTGPWWANRIGALVTTLADVPDPDGSLQRWFDDHAADVVVVRPDRYVLAAGGSLDSITDAVRPQLLEESSPG